MCQNNIVCVSSFRCEAVFIRNPHTNAHSMNFLIGEKIKTVKRRGLKECCCRRLSRMTRNAICVTFSVLTDACFQPLSYVSTCLFVRITCRDKYTGLVLKKISHIFLCTRPICVIRMVFDVFML